MYKRIAALMIGLTMVAGLITGCGAGQKAEGSKTGEQAPSKSKEPVTITFAFPTENQSSDDYFKGVCENFSKEHPDIKVEMNLMPNANKDMDVKLTAAGMSGMYPDVVSAYLIYIGTRGPRGEFMDLKPFIDKWADKDDMQDPVFGFGKLNGKYLGLAFFPNPNMLVYRKDFFKEAGLDPEKPPKNWDDLAAYSKKLVVKDASGNVTRAGLDIPALGEETIFYSFLRQNGSLIDANADKGTPSITDKASVEALDFMTGLVKAGVAIAYDYGKSDEKPILKGKSAMGWLVPAQVSKLLTTDPTMKDKIGFAPSIMKQQQSTFTGNRLFVIAESSKYKEQSWEFIKYMMSKEQMMERAQKLSIPVVRKSLEAEYVKLNPELNKAVVENAKYGKGALNYVWASIVNKHLDVAYQEAYLGKKTAEQALKDGEAAMKKDLENVAQQPTNDPNKK